MSLSFLRIQWLLQEPMFLPWLLLDRKQKIYKTNLIIARLSSLLGRPEHSGTAPRGHAAGQQLSIEGQMFSIGSDWLVRVGNVILAGGAVKGMLLEAEYLPLPVLHSPIADGTSELLSNLLTSVLPNVRDAKTVAVTISDTQWEDVLWDQEEEERGTKEQEMKRDESEIYAYGDEDIVEHKRGDWVGVDRDRRSAYLIMGALRSEGIL